VPAEDRVGVVTEAGLQSIHFALLGVIQAQFVDVVRRLWVGRAEFAKGDMIAAPQRKARTLDGLSIEALRARHFSEVCM
jgi:hypothetical protein